MAGKFVPEICLHNFSARARSETPRVDTTKSPAECLAAVSIAILVKILLSLVTVCTCCLLVRRHSMAIHNFPFSGCAKITQNNIFADRGRANERARRCSGKNLELGPRPRPSSSSRKRFVFIVLKHIETSRYFPLMKYRLS